VAAVKQLRDEGTPNYWDAAAAVRDDMLSAFVSP